MGKNEQGFVLPIILFLSVILSAWVVGSLPYFVTSHRILMNEFGKWQATSNAEAGIDFAIEEWEKTNVASGHSYSLVKGSAQVSITDEGENLYIVSVGEALTNYKDVIIVTYQKAMKKIVHWHGGG